MRLGQYHPHVAEKFGRLAVAVPQESQTAETFPAILGWRRVRLPREPVLGSPDELGDGSDLLG